MAKKKKQDETTVTIEAGDKSVTTTVEAMSDATDALAKDVADLVFDGMPDPADMHEVTITGKDFWFGYPGKPRIGQAVQIRALAHVTQFGTREGKEGEPDIEFVKLRTTYMDTVDDAAESYRSAPRDVRHE